MSGLQNPQSARSTPMLGTEGQNPAYMDPILAAIASLTDQMKSMSAVLKDVHGISYQHSATLQDHAHSLNRMAPEVKNPYASDGNYLRHVPGSSQASTRDSTPQLKGVFPANLSAGRIVSGPTTPQLGFGIPATQPYRIAPSPPITDEAARPPLPSPQAQPRRRVTDNSPKSPNLTARSARPVAPAARRASIPARSPSVTRSAAAAARDRLHATKQPAPSTLRSKSPVRTAGVVSRAKSPARVPTGPAASVRSRSPAPTQVSAQMRSKSPARTGGQVVAAPGSIAQSAPRPTTPLIRYEVQISFNDRIVARSQVSPALTQDGPFLYVVQSELAPALSFIPVPGAACPFTGLSVSIVGTNTRTRRSNVVFKSHESHVDNPPVNDADGYFSHSCWLSGPSASVVGGLRVFFKTADDGSVTLYAMSLKFWFPETAENGLAEQVPNFTKEHFKELLRLLGVL